MDNGQKLFSPIDKLEFVGELTGEGTGNILKDLLRCEEQGTGSAAAALSIANIGIIGR